MGKKLFKFLKSAKSSEKNEETEPNILNLPEEILIEILKNLSYEDLVKVGAVCKKFRGLAKSPILCSRVTMDIYKNHEAMSVTAMKFIKALPKSVTHLKINFDGFDDSVLYAKDVLKILRKKAPNLRVLAFNTAKIGSRDFSHSMVYLCEKIMPSIRVLVFRHCDFRSGLKIYSLDTVHKSPKIEVIDASFSVLEEEPDDIYYRFLIDKMPILKRLSLAGLYLHDYPFNFDPSRISHLIALDLERTIVTSYRALQIFGHNLAELYVCYTDVGDDCIVSYASDVKGRPIFPSLKILCLVGCTRVTRKSVDFLTESCPSLQRVYVGPNHEYPERYNRFEDYSSCKSGKVRIINTNDFCNHYAKIDYMNA